MEISRATELMIELMDQHRLFAQGWTGGWNNRKRALGVCKSRSKSIELSRPLVLVNDEKVIRNTILHEIAHAIAGYDAGHGPMWKLVAIRVGAEPVSCAATANRVLPNAPWQAICTGCGQVVQRFRKPRRIISCGTCCPHVFNSKFQFSFQRMQS